MNASFRTAFWALCLSLGVPLSLLVGAELYTTATGASAKSPESSKQKPHLLAAGTSSRPIPPDRMARATAADRGVQPVMAARPSRDPEVQEAVPARAQSERATKVDAPALVRPAPRRLDQSPGGAASLQLLPQLEMDGNPAHSTAIVSAPATAADSRIVTPRQAVAVLPPAPFISISRSTESDQVIADPDAMPVVPLNRGLQARLTRLQQNVDQLAQAQQQQQFDQLQQTTQLLQQLQQNNQLEAVERQLQNLRAAQRKSQNADESNGTDDNTPSLAEPDSGTVLAPGKPRNNPKKKSTGKGAAQLGAGGTGATSADDSAADASEDGDAGKQPTRKLRDEKSSGNETSVLKASPDDDGSEHFSLQIKDAEISEVLDMIGQLSGKNILTTPEVSGKVTANLHHVDIEQALKAILRAGGFVFEQDGDFVYVSTPQESDAKAALARKVLVKVYRPNYISVKEVKALITPLLTPVVGKISVTDPSEVGIASGSTAAGGDSLAQRDAILVQDYQEVLLEVDRVILEMDVPAMQVVIEAKILSVRLTDSLEFGINFALLNGPNNSLLVSGDGATLFGTSGSPGNSGATIVPPVGQFLADTAGLKYGFIRGDISMFLNALENIADTNLIASPQLMVLNKQRAELIIGSRLPYKTLAFNGTQTAENVNFLDAGTKLRIRPFIAPDGLVRMEIHPERSTATKDSDTNLPVLTTTEVTSNVMVRDGNTLVIGGLIEEQVVEQYSRVPFLGALPVVGAAFRNKNESIVRSELIILITPRIVSQANAADQGATLDYENADRADHFRDNLTRINRRNLARMQFEQAQYHFERGNLLRARDFVMRCLFYSKNDLQAIQLKERIDQTLKSQTFPWSEPPVEPAPFLNPPGIDGMLDLESTTEPDAVPAPPAPGDSSTTAPLTTNPPQDETAPPLPGPEVRNPSPEARTNSPANAKLNTVSAKRFFPTLRRSKPSSPVSRPSLPDAEPATSGSTPFLRVSDDDLPPPPPVIP